jgi:sRNA-binding protein
MLGAENKERKGLEVCEILKRELPLCFKTNRPKQPLKLDIYQDLLDYYSNETRFTSQDLSRAVKIYLSSQDYLASLVAGAERLDIWGRAAGRVTASQAKRAQWLLNARKSSAQSLALFTTPRLHEVLMPAIQTA